MTKFHKLMLAGVSAMAMAMSFTAPANATNSGGCWYCGGGVKEKSASFGSGANGMAVNEGQALASGKHTKTLSESVTTKDLGAGGSANVPANGKPTANAWSYADFKTAGISMSMAVGKNAASAASMEAGAAQAAGSAETEVDE